jgi:uncharacterized membrane protein
MPPKERFAWSWIAALVLVFGTYFTAVKVRSHAELPFLTQIGMLAIALSVLALLAIAVHLVGRRDAGSTSFDERDRLIQARSTSAGYYVLMAGMIVVGCVMPFSSGKWDIVHAALLSIAIAEIVSSGLVVAAYRRGFSV